MPMLLQYFSASEWSIHRAPMAREVSCSSKARSAREAAVELTTQVREAKSTTSKAPTGSMNFLASPKFFIDNSQGPVGLFPSFGASGQILSFCRARFPRDPPFLPRMEDMETERPPGDTSLEWIPLAACLGIRELR